MAHVKAVVFTTEGTENTHRRASLAQGRLRHGGENGMGAWEHGGMGENALPAAA